MAIIEYDHSPNISPEQRLRSLADSVRRAFEELENKGGSKGNDVLKLGAVASENIVPMKKGGTEASTAAGARQNINFIGVNPIASFEEDTTANWASLGTGVAYISGDDKVSNQPYTYGFIENHVYGSVVRQIWYSQSIQGNMYMRAGIASGWYTPWIKVLNENNGIQFEKVWTNASPKSGFPAQDITEDWIDDYDLFLVRFRTATTDNYSHYVFAIKGETSIVNIPINATSSTYVMQNIHRRVLFSTNGYVRFTDAYYKTMSGTTATVSENYLIPFEFYGIKGVQ